ncbi:MAG: DUF1836 domain-containing protein [Oscillospiraceae bacterium]|nr:DUF1836 domain-containing protein [Oscillospiraceae bacterium]
MAAIDSNIFPFTGLEGLCLPKWEEMPDLDIYMDQLLALITRYLKGGPESYSKDLTPSMVNNYVKQSIIPAPVKKKYNRPHLAALLIVCLLKPVLPIPEIGRIILLGQQADATLQTLYQLFYTELSGVQTNHDTPLAQTLQHALLARSYQAMVLKALSEGNEEAFPIDC